MPSVIVETVSSTAEAVRVVSYSDEAFAAVGSKIAAEIYGLNILFEKVQDSDKNRTSFIVVRKTIHGQLCRDIYKQLFFQRQMNRALYIKY